MSLDLNNIKEQIQTILEAANTTTATHDLSTGLNTRVQQILKVNPNRLGVQASWYPFVTIFIDRKAVNQADIASTQLQAKRRWLVDVKLVGAVMNTVISNPNDDQADEDCESLMENIEEVIRRSSTLNGAVLWTAVSEVTYHSGNIDDGANIRVGILNLEATVLG